MTYSYSQTNVCINSTINYIVDGDPSVSGDVEDGGTNGSTYTWTITGPNDISGDASSPFENQFVVDWSNATLNQTYTITVQETSSDGCLGDVQELQVTVIAAPNTPTINAPAVCSGIDAVFTISGDNGATVTYSINGGGDETVVIESDGDVDVVVTGATTDQTLTISNIESGSGCSANVTVIATVTINPLPVTSPIGTN